MGSGCLVKETEPGISEKTSVVVVGEDPGKGTKGLFGCVGKAGWVEVEGAAESENGAGGEVSQPEELGVGGGGGEALGGTGSLAQIAP